MLRVLYDTHNKAIISLNSINSLASVVETHCVAFVRKNLILHAAQLEEFQCVDLKFIL